MRRKYADKNAKSGIFLGTRVMFAFRNKVVLGIFSQFTEKNAKTAANHLDKVHEKFTK